MLGRLEMAVSSRWLDDLFRYELRFGVSLTWFGSLLLHGDLPVGCHRLVTVRIMGLLGVRELTVAGARRLVTGRIRQETGLGSIEEFKAAWTAGTIDRCRWPVMELHGDLLTLAGMLYVIGPPGRDVVKIGRSCNVPLRLGSLQAASPQPLTIRYVAPGAYLAESAVHERFRERRLHGEWFDLAGTDPSRRSGTA